jgi:dihydrodipicolinate synthase/N-acetylneuraminate lyase
METKKVEGIVPVMLTPFTKDDHVDYSSLERLIDMVKCIGGLYKC